MSQTIIAALRISMGIKVSVSCTVLFALLDIVISTVLYTRGSQLIIFRDDVLDFNILHSALDMWGTVILRASLLLGASIGVSWNKEDGPQRVATLSTLILLVCLIIITYALAKMLMLSELEALTQQPWFLSLVAWTCASSLAVTLLWSLLGKQPMSVSSHESGTNSTSSTRGGSEDTEKLVGTGGEEEREAGGERKKQQEKGGQEKEESSSGATLGRLLTFCKKDSGLLSVAVLFLLISAVCEWSRHCNTHLLSHSVFSLTVTMYCNIYNISPAFPLQFITQY